MRLPDKTMVLKILSAILLLIFVFVFNGCSDSDSKVTAKNIILIIGDGMQEEHEVAASRYLFGTDYGLSFHPNSGLLPYRTFVATWDIDTYDRYAFTAGKALYEPSKISASLGYDPAKGGKMPYPSDTTGQRSYFLTKLKKSATDAGGYPATDSASAGTAIATGHKTDNGNISWLTKDPPNGAIKTIAELMREKNKASIGVVSTVPFNHATPAVFVSHNVHRNNYYTGYRGYSGLGIADEIITKTKPDVVIGAGWHGITNPSFETTKGFISRANYDTLKSSNEYIFVERKQGIDGGVSIINGANEAVSRGKKLFGLFGGNHLFPDGKVESSDLFEPPVPSNNPGSPSVARGSIENPLLKDAVKAALTVLSQNKNGFFLMAEQGDIDWANHANNYKWMIGAVWDMHEAVKAVIEFVDKPNDDITWENTLLIVTSDHGNSYMRLNNAKKLGKGALPRQDYSPNTTTSDGYSTNWTYPDGEVAYSSSEHTNELVNLYAKGAAASLFVKYEGAWYPGTRIIDNTHIFKVMAEAAQVPDDTALTVVASVLLPGIGIAVCAISLRRKK